eukprot:gb/GFBE01023689.1/.p1 GENE.gb/GFBE01023689.1/~~gb/GFBE01023689.1/.p1  ORF type:complete len:271 (+),score=61.17 gb/GFBE01023689.1/:1-813(+)
MAEGSRRLGRRRNSFLLSSILLLWLPLNCYEAFTGLSSQLYAAARAPFRGGRSEQLEQGRHRRLLLSAVKQSEQQATETQKKAKLDPDRLAFETAKFNVAWTKMKEAEEQKSPELASLKKEVDDLAKVVESLGGSRPADMMTEDEAQKRVQAIREDLSLEKLMKMSNEERWILAQGLGPAFPIALILAYTFYWALNVPFIAYAYYTTVVTGATTMAIVMAGAYATSIPFKPLVYIGAILLTPWTAETVLPPLGKVFGMFKLPDEDDWNRL